MKNKRRIIFSSFLIVLFITICSVIIYGYSTINKVNKVELPQGNEELGIEEAPAENTKLLEENKQGNGPNKNTGGTQPEAAQQWKAANILLMGVDKGENASDTMIVLTLDESNQKIKLTSLMRDSKVYFGEGKINKLNYAYHYGGPLLTIKTINETYKLDIKNYIKVDFEALIAVIDTLGGVDINVKAEEIDYLNSVINIIAEQSNLAPKTVKAPGMQRLSGLQALGYSRIRKIGNQDFERTERQRKVLESLFKRLKDTPAFKYPSILSQITPLIESSMDTGELLSIIGNGMSYGRNGIEQTRLPIDGTWSHDTSGQTYYLNWNKQPNLEHLHKFIYGNTLRIQ
jgi:LCP family protein required for cell wall assembly